MGKEIRICEICGQKFEIKKNGNNRVYCYDCSPSITKDISASESIYIKRRAIKRQLVKEAGGKCQKCGYNKCIRALEFHHLDPNQKDFGISRNMTRGMSEMRKEISKCVLLCSNCHAEEHERLIAEGYSQFKSDI